MAVSNHERVGKALDLLTTGVRPFVERELRAHHGEKWEAEARATVREDRSSPKTKDKTFHWDAHALLGVLWNEWNLVFGKTLGRAERSLVSELREVRNRWAHQETFTTDDAYRVLDSVQRLLQAVSADEAVEVERQKQDLLRVRYEEQTRREHRKVAETAVAGQPAGGLKPWREIVTPHRDVASGRYQQAEFAADLGQVHRGEGVDEYRNPSEFFRRTFLTEGLRHLLVNALLRLSGNGGDPVVDLQTNFGGGKTHSMLALYHLVAGVSGGELPGIDGVLHDERLVQAGVTQPISARRAVIVGTAVSPGQAHQKSDGTVVHTFWGDLAWQLLGKKGYKLVAAADSAGVSPGSDVLRDLFTQSGPTLILIDEWVAYARQLYGKDNLPAGSFDANLTFAQALTEAARAAKTTFVVASIPASDIEIGGEGGQAALDRLKNTFGRVESPWRPASAEESFEIVRRRLFEPIQDPALARDRDVVARAFADLYRTQAQEFPSACREGKYERRIQAAYPVHPELFDRLYEDWSSLDKFQRTRGVLRLMAAVIHSLWERQDGGLLIMPASVPVDDGNVQFELTRYLPEPWVPVIEKDVDGPNSLPLQLDRDNSNLGRYSACRRVARTVYVGSAPTAETANRGIEDQQIKLGCVQPGESVATFGDALRRLTDGATHLYVDNKRYWYSTQESVTRAAQDLAARFDRDVIEEEIKRRLRDAQRSRGDFAKVHACPESSGEVPDDRETRLVILSPEKSHIAKSADSSARAEAAAMLEQRGSSPRRYRNSLLFLAADRTRLGELEQAVRQFLAWKTIDDEKDVRNLDTFQRNQAKTKRQQAEEAIEGRVPETYCWLLLPAQSAAGAPVEWQEIRLQGQDTLAARASRKLKNDGLLLTQLGGTLLRLELDRVPLWRGDHVLVRQLADDFAQYVYLPRLRDTDVLLASVRDGVAQISWKTDTFAYAERWDEAASRYRALQAGRVGTIALDGEGVVVKSETAARQTESDRAAHAPSAPVGAYPAEASQPDGQVSEGSAATRHPACGAASTAVCVWTRIASAATPARSPTTSSRTSRGS
jgi:predicted AAA+ superfamily ATPase